MRGAMATAASLMAPSAVVWSSGSAAKERFIFVSNLKDRRCCKRSFRTVVCAAGERKKSFQQRLKAKQKTLRDAVKEEPKDEKSEIESPELISPETRIPDARAKLQATSPETGQLTKTPKEKQKPKEEVRQIETPETENEIEAVEEALEEENKTEIVDTKAELQATGAQKVSQAGSETGSVHKQGEVDYVAAKQKLRDGVKQVQDSVRELVEPIQKIIDKRIEVKDLGTRKDIEASAKRERDYAAVLREQEVRRRQEEEAAAAKQKEIELALAREAELKRKQELEARRRKIELALALERERVAKEEARKREVAKLSVSTLNKIFYYPQKVEAGAEVEIYLNRSKTSLADAKEVRIMGSFNDWRWQSFNLNLEKCELTGDWWSCKVQVPSEAYKMEFVFFNGENVYENNDSRDFFIIVERGMDEQEFEKFLMLEKRKEAERLAREEEERERAAEEARKLAELRAAEEADRAEAARIVGEQRGRAREIQQKAVSSLPGLWEVEPSSFKGGQTVTLFYNPSSRALAQSSEIWIHGGYNNWKEAVSIVKMLSPSPARSGGWWSVEVFVPKKAFMLNWVFADGPPEKASKYDNNDYQDFHTLVPEPILEDLYWAEVEETIYVDIRSERHKREAAALEKLKLKARMKEEMKQRTKQEFLQSQSHVYYTEPAELRAGQPVSLFYNPSNTVLNGKPEVWLRHSFNRWTHPLSPFAPVKMLGAGASHLKATVEVPEDAYIMDFVLSERGDDDGGAYDNKNGFDYHIPVVGSFAKEPPLTIFHISLEMAPVAKVGGLGDVVTSLSRAVKELGHNVEVILPKYDCMKYNHIQELQEKEPFDWGGTRIRVWNGKVEGLNVHFLEPENGFFWVGCIYGRRDDGQRFGFFCSAALEFLLRTGKHPDIIHCHDWSSAPAAWLFQESYKQYGLSNVKIVFTIHNMEFGLAQIGKAMANANIATTVSHSYAHEVSGSPAISPHRHKFHGIRNGIDPDIWDPFDDPHIPVSYTSETAAEGKKAAKNELQHRLGLQRVDKPLLGVITRLTAQKGIHLIKHAIWRTLERGGQVVLLGSAPDPRVQNDFVNLSNQLNHTQNDMARLCLTYDEPLSHLIYAAADIILVPSIFEPCGLTQLIAMRYGAIPVVRKTGGLNDTVFDVDHDQERAKAQGLECNGFSFEGTDAGGVDYALNRAISAWYEARDWFDSLCCKVMEQDWSWNRPALDYVELYHIVRK